TSTPASMMGSLVEASITLPAILPAAGGASCATAARPTASSSTHSTRAEHLRKPAAGSIDDPLRCPLFAHGVAPRAGLAGTLDAVPPVPAALLAGEGLMTKRSRCHQTLVRSALGGNLVRV